MLNNTKSFLLLDKKVIYNNFIKDIQLEIDTQWLNERNFISLFNEFNPDYSLFMYHKKVKFFDYKDEAKVMEMDSIENSEQHKIKNQPTLALYSNESDTINFSSKNLKFIADFVFGVREIVGFHEDTVALKNVPSVGARHGISLFQNLNQLYYYNPIIKELIKTPEVIGNKHGLFICLRPEVYMWRYKTSYCLFDIYYDIGHIVGCINIIELVKNKEIRTRFKFPEENYSSIEAKNIIPLLEMVTKDD